MIHFLKVTSHHLSKKTVSGHFKAIFTESPYKRW